MSRKICKTIQITSWKPPEPFEIMSGQELKRTVLVSNYIWSTLLTLLIMAPIGGSIDCFKCVSLNGNNPSCEDPFHNNYSVSILESPCMGGRKGRNGLFPATACIKLIGTYHDNGHTVVVRGCALDSNTLTTDTEIIRMSHCGGFEFDDRYVHGCLQSCDDADGCNISSHLTSTPQFLLIASFILFIFYNYYSPHYHLHIITISILATCRFF